MKKQLQLSRRTVLRGLGTAVALPWMEAMLPASALGRTAKASSPRPIRAVFLYVPNGMHMDKWTSDRVGPLNELPPILEPLAAHRSQVLLLGGLGLEQARPLGDGPGDHARSVSSFLTGAHPRKTQGRNLRNGVSVDQVAASAIGHATRFPSLELGCEPSAQSGRCDSGYSCAYTSTISWRTATSPMIKEINPRALFDRLFGGGDASEDGRRRALQVARNKSVLDFVRQEARSLHGRLGRRDRHKLDEYLYAVGQIERRIEWSEKLAEVETDVPDYPRPAGVPADYDEHVRLMMDIMALALATDSTRVVSFMFTNATSNRSYPQIGVRSGHHRISHHGGDRQKLAQISKINRHHVTHLAYLLDRLKAAEEDEGNVLDNAMIVYGSGIRDGDHHDHHDLPILLAGGGGGTLAPGRYIRYPEKTPLSNLYLSMLHRLGIPQASLGDSSGPLPELS